MARRVIEESGLKDWQRWLVSLQNSEVANTQSRILRSAGLRALEHLDDLTPVRTGRLKGSMSMGDQDNVFKLQAGSRAYVFVGTAVQYAPHVNDGFTQLAGQFVPGYWRGHTFHYDPNHSGGMVLTGKVIPGAHMFEKAMGELESDLPQILEYEFRRLYQKLFS
ncbi:HK97 gp10 family phage protein [Paenibacillus sp. MMO-177]|uniref:HK97 gp10 family phage protein n=1 Tax=Paenibacillus sp. MMO-177 TaxID=3081289 RepID=UPI00301801AA